MKVPYLKYLLGFVLFLSSHVGFSKDRNGDSLSCLKITGLLISPTKTGEYRLELYCKDKKVDSMILANKNMKFEILLDKNTFYTIRISRHGYHSKSICFDTSLPCNYKQLYTYEFQVELKTDNYVNPLKKNGLQVPVALIYFDEKHNGFDYNKRYTRLVNQGREPVTQNPGYSKYIFP